MSLKVDKWCFVSATNLYYFIFCYVMNIVNFIVYGEGYDIGY